MTRSSRRLTHLELHAMVMIERSFYPNDPTKGLREESYQIPVTKEDKAVGIVGKVPGSSLRASGTRKLSLTTKPGTANFIQSIHLSDETTFSSKISTHWEVSRPSSIHDPSNSRAFHGSPRRTTSLKRDSLVLQRVKAFDNNCKYGSSYKRPHYLITLLADNSSEIHKDTVSRFPKPPKVPPAPLLMERGRQ